MALSVRIIYAIRGNIVAEICQVQIFPVASEIVILFDVMLSRYACNEAWR